MTHAEALAHDAADEYVRGLLNPGEREAFEEHYFSCDECFAEVQAAEALRSAVRSGAVRGALPGVPVRPAATARWVLPYAASALLATGLGWSLFVRQPALESELDAVRSERDALVRLDAPVATEELRVEPNVPIAFLEAERGTAAMARIDMPSGGSQVIVAISAPAADDARLEVRTQDGTLVTAVDGLRRNLGGTYVAALPAARLPDGRYRLRLLAGLSGSNLIGEYLLQVSRTR